MLQDIPRKFHRKKVRMILQKMQVQLQNGVAHYSLRGDNQLIDMNNCIGKTIHIHYQGIISCLHCGTHTKKSFGQGYCYPCFLKIPETEECVLHPEKCRAHIGIARDMVYAESHCLIPQYVYLAETSDVKIGVTRSTQIPTRWIDQGALQACIIAKTPNRYTAGCIEVALKQYIGDKTNWQKMLTKQHCECNISEFRSKILTYLPREYQEYIIDSPIEHITYPGITPTDKIKSLKLDTAFEITKQLQGIKGQYLLFSDNSVMNIRSHAGYMVEIDVK